MISRMADEYATGDTARALQLVNEVELLKSLNCSTESIANAVADGTLFFEMKDGQSARRQLS